MKKEQLQWNYNQNSIFLSIPSSWFICGSSAFWFCSFCINKGVLISLCFFFRRQIIITQIKQTEIPPKTILIIENMYILLLFSSRERFEWKRSDLEKTFVFLNSFEAENEQDGEKTDDFVNACEGLNVFEFVNWFDWENSFDDVNGFDLVNCLDDENFSDLVKLSE